jgi:DNA segregation ATPase FtsK/SpoIIIE, S-DNA-T family
VSKAKERRFVPTDPIEERVETLLSQRGREMRALLLIGFCLYALLAVFTFEKAGIAPPGEAVSIPRDGLANAGGSFGYLIASGLLYLFGMAGWLPFGFLLAFGLMRLLGHTVDRRVLKALGVVVFTALVAILLTSPSDAMVSTDSPYGPGGRFGLSMSPKLFEAFGGSGRLLLVLFGCILSFLLATEWAFSQLILRGVRATTAGVERIRAGRAGESEDEDGEYDEDEEDEEDNEEWEYEDEDEEQDDEEWEYEDEEEELEEEEPAPAAKKKAAKGAKGNVKPKSKSKPKAKPAVEAETPAVEVPRPVPKKAAKKPVVKINRPKPIPASQQKLPFDEAYPYPPVDLFQEPPPPDKSFTDELVRKNAAAIERRLASFKIEANVVGVAPGPAVTQYELRIAEGIKVAKITSFEPDLAAALKAVSVRVVAPIPGRDTVGVEVPNPKRQMVVLRELLETRGKTEKFGIPLFLGRDVSGEPIVEDLSTMPHLLIAGTTGSGKSVCINTIILSVLLTRTPKQVRLILIDPKMVELQVYSSVPHLACPVVTSMKKAPGALDWAVEEMETRYAKLSSVRTNNIRSYNKLGQAELEKRLDRPVAAEDVELPYILVVIDELADLMSVAAKEVEDHIQRLAQKSRAVGIHVILATQRPSTDVITGVIKANLPCTVGFKVSRKIDSRVILDANGAEKLLGHGDMLYIGPGTSSVVRAQGAFVSEDEIHRVVDYLDEKGARQSFIPDLVQTQTARKRSAKARDDLYEQAVEVVLGQQRGSATLLQRALSVGYTRATRLLELMEQDGLVGPYNGSKSREVHLTIEEWQVQESDVAREPEDASAPVDDFDEAVSVEGGTT